jgi:ribonuclease HI
MIDFETLCSIAYKKERAISRRLAKRAALSEQEALRQTLVDIAGNRSLDDLVMERRQMQSKAIEKIALRKQDQADALASKKASKQPDPTAWLAWFDGATSPNPGKMGIGGLLKSPDGSTFEISYAAGHGDSNEAEYLALIAVLKEAVHRQPAKLVVYGDSQVIINEMRNGVGAASLQKHRDQAKLLSEQLNAVTLTWIPRKRNSEADALSQLALLK